MSSEVALRVEGLSKRYRLGSPGGYRTLRDAVSEVLRSPFGARSEAPPPDLWALRDLSFEVRRGEVLGIVGRNGAGKSTLLKILSRITEPTSGRAVIHGRVSSLLEVGTGFHPELTGRENVYLNGAILGMGRREIERKLDAIVDFAGVERFIDTPVKRFSSGMYVRLAFAVAAHVEPDILLVDEVLAVGDIAFQRKCLGRMQSVAEEGRTVLFVSHSMGAVATLCTSALWLDHGQAAQRGDVAGILSMYKQSLAEPGGGASGTSELRVVSIRVAGAPEDGSFPPFGACRVETVFETQRALQPVEVNLHVEDAQGTQCIHLRTDFDGLYPELGPGRHRVELEIESLNLESQIYFFKVRVVGRNPLVVADSEAVPVEVRAPWDRHPKTQPIVAVKRRWSFSTE